MARFIADGARVLDRYGPLWLSVDQACARMATLAQQGAHSSGQVRRDIFDDVDDLRMAIIDASEPPSRPDFLSVAAGIVAPATQQIERAA